MSKIQVLIEVDEEGFNNFVNDWVGATAMLRAVSKGKPLPKGHGDLVDFDRLCEEYWDGNYMEIHKDDLSNIKPIIEAEEG